MNPYHPFHPLLRMRSHSKTVSASPKPRRILRFNDIQNLILAFERLSINDQIEEEPEELEELEELEEQEVLE